MGSYWIRQSHATGCAEPARRRRWHHAETDVRNGGPGSGAPFALIVVDLRLKPTTPLDQRFVCYLAMVQTAHHSLDDVVVDAQVGKVNSVAVKRVGPQLFGGATTAQGDGAPAWIITFRGSPMQSQHPTAIPGTVGPSLGQPNGRAFAVRAAMSEDRADMAVRWGRPGDYTPAVPGGHQLEAVLELFGVVVPPARIGRRRALRKLVVTIFHGGVRVFLRWWQNDRCERRTGFRLGRAGCCTGEREYEPRDHGKATPAHLRVGCLAPASPAVYLGGVHGAAAALAKRRSSIHPSRMLGVCHAPRARASVAPVPDYAREIRRFLLPSTHAAGE